MGQLGFYDLDSRLKALYNLADEQVEYQIRD